MSDFDDLWNNNEMWMYRSVRDACEYAYLAGQASAEQRVKDLERQLANEQERHRETKYEWEMACERYNALKAQAGEPVKPVCFGLDDCSSRALSVCSVRDECGKAAK